MPRKPAILIGFIVLAYAAVRLWRLTDTCLWFDEIFGIHAAEHSWAELISFVAKDLIHPPLFYLLLKIWITVGGESLLWLRLFPVLFAVLALVPLWMLCRELKLRSTTVIVMFALFAVNGALIKYVHEVRMYSLLLFLSLASIWLFSRFFFRGKSFWMLVLANVFLVYSHYFGWFVVASEVVAIAVAQRIKILQTLLMLGVVAVAFVPWVLALARFAEPGSSVTQNIGWMQRPGLRSVLDFAFDLVDPFYFQQSSVAPSANVIIALPLAVLLTAALVIYFARFKAEENKQRVFLLAVFAIVPLLLAFVLSWLLPVSIWGSRHLLIVFAPVMLLTSIFLTEIAPEFLRRGLMAVVFLLTAAAFVLQLFTPPERQIWCAWEGLATDWVLARQDSSQPKKLYAFEDLVAYHYWFATRSLPKYQVTLLKPIEGVKNDPAYFLPRGFTAVPTAALDSVSEDEIWISFRKPTEKSRQGEGFLNDGFDRLFQAPVNSFEEMGYQVVDVKKDVIGSHTAYLIRMVKQSRGGSGN